MIYFDYLSEVFSGLLLAFHPEIFTAPCSLISFVPTAQSILTKIVIRKTKARFSHPCGATFGRPIFLWKIVIGKKQRLAFFTPAGRPPVVQSSFGRLSNPGGSHRAFGGAN
jgi:hypothetical protein